MFLVFKACEMHITCMPLDPQQQKEKGADGGVCGSFPPSADGREKEEEMRPNPIQARSPRVDTTKKPAFLPASTTERSFTYVPH